MAKLNRAPLTDRELWEIYLKNPNSTEAVIFKQKMDFLQFEAAMIKEIRKILQEDAIFAQQLAEMTDRVALSSSKEEDVAPDLSVVETAVSPTHTSDSAWIAELLATVSQQLTSVKALIIFIAAQIAAIQEHRREITQQLLIPALQNAQQYFNAMPIVHYINGGTVPVRIDGHISRMLDHVINAMSEHPEHFTSHEQLDGAFYDAAEEVMDEDEFYASNGQEIDLDHLELEYPNEVEYLQDRMVMEIQQQIQADREYAMYLQAELNTRENDLRAQSDAAEDLQAILQTQETKIKLPEFKYQGSRQSDEEKIQEANRALAALNKARKFDALQQLKALKLAQEAQQSRHAGATYAETTPFKTPFETRLVRKKD